MRSASCWLLALILSACAPRPASVEEPAALLTHGVAVGDISATRAVLWARCDKPTAIHVNLRAQDGSLARIQHTEAAAQHDLIGKLAVAGLQPGRHYTYRVWCGDTSAGGLRSAGAENGAQTGTFSTAAPADARTPVRFAWGGDLGGQNVCRDRQRGYAIFDAIRATSPDFFVALGDMIYADDGCKEVGLFGNQQIPGPPAPALTREMFWAIWKYNRADPAFQRLLSAVPIYPVWDDHEILNDAGPHQDALPVAPQTHLFAAALQAYLDFQPMLPDADDPTRFYSSVRWGKHLELFVLDLRQYRDANLAPDSAEHPKTMLGDEQRRWLIDALRRSSATWKVVVSSVPLSIPTRFRDLPNDGWTGMGSGDGFERERAVILDAMRQSSPRNFVWITTDVHFGAVFRYRPFREDPDFVFDELVSGPLTAGIFPIDDYDRTLGTERLLKYSPATADAVADFDEAVSWFNFGVIEVNESGDLTSKLINGRGEVVYEATRSPR